MVCFLPNEFMAPANQVVQEEASPDINEDEQLGLMAQLVLAKQATFDKPAKKSTYEAAVVERIRQWQAVDQDVC
jgi:non-homologous end joining protein Ku